MNKELMFGAGLGIGTLAMFMLDPDRGRSRRARVREKLASTARKTGEGIGVTARDLSNRAHGVAASIQSKFTSDKVDDAVLVDRVRSKLGRVVSHPGAIHVSAENGNVTLSGPILEEEVDYLLARVRRMQNVNEVVNNLELHKEAGNHPALQGGRHPQGHRFEFLQENWSPAARFIAGATGASLAVYGGTRRDALGAGLGAAGLLLLTRGITNTEFKRLAGFDDRLKSDRQRSSLAQETANPQKILNQSSTATM